jgi:hypothetical protein
MPAEASDDASGPHEGDQDRRDDDRPHHGGDIERAPDPGYAPAAQHDEAAPAPQPYTRSDTPSYTPSYEPAPTPAYAAPQPEPEPVRAPEPTPSYAAPVEPPAPAEPPRREPAPPPEGVNVVVVDQAPEPDAPRKGGWWRRLSK